MIDPLAPDFADSPASDRRPSFVYAPVDAEGSPSISILTPFYNTGELFHETAKSVLRQSLQQWEWIIVNDGSTDPDALSVLAQYRDSDPRIRVIDLPENVGPSAARNAGYRLARTPYVLQLDSDNLIEPTAAEKWFWFLESHPEHAFVKGYSVGFGAEEYLWSRGFHEGSAFLEENLVDATSLVRRSVHEAVGGYDEGIRGGLEDWDFWLRCADQGYWGGSVPEYLDWYRRRADHGERWPNWDEAERQRAFHAELRRRYPDLWEAGFPRTGRRHPMSHDPVPDVLPTENLLTKSQPRLLLIAPWMTMGGADRFNLDLLEWLTSAGWEVTIATTLDGDHSWLPRFAQGTPDIFPLQHFLRSADFPRFLRYLIQSRDVDAVLISHSELAYLLLPYLRAHHPDVAFMDYCHIEEEYWENGGYPRISIEHGELLDLTGVTSEHLKRWMVERGGDADRIEVCYIGADGDRWRPDDRIRNRVRLELEVPDDCPVILFAGRIAAQKQPRVLGQTLLRLQRRGIRFTGVIAGDGPDMATLRSFVAGHGLESHVRFAGGVAIDRVRELMLASDVFFLPSLWEGIALTLFEAMACELPVVAADVGGQSELVSSDCGVLVTPDDGGSREAEAYADALERLLSSPELRRSMGRRGRLRLQNGFSTEEASTRMLSLIDLGRRLHREQPRPQPTLGVARACAFQAVELLRLTQVADELWAQRDQSDLRVRLYARFARTFEPLYQWGMKRGWNWLAAVRTRLRLSILGRR